MRSTFWNNKKVFLTGHTGFKGGWLSLLLKSFGSEITGYSLSPPTSPSFFEAASVGRHLTSVEGDVKDLRLLTETMRDSEPEIVFHLAAQPLVRESYLAPHETFATNLLGTVCVLEAIRSVPSVRAAVIVTTDKCYENREWEWGYRESDQLGGRDPYSASKACAEIATAAYRESYFSPSLEGFPAIGIATVRAGNVLGGGDWARDRLVPDLVRSFMSGMSAPIRNPGAIRPWQHVLDPLRGYVILAEHLFDDTLNFSKSWNFGPFEGGFKSVDWLASALANRWGDNATWIEDTNKHPHESRILKLDVSRSCAELNWAPLLSLDTTLDYVVDWYKAYGRKEDMEKFSISQIRKFQTLQHPR